MNNISETELGTICNTLETKSVTATVVNTHCIVCGKQFEVPRMSKLYCSTRCKQFGYNHKNEISQAIAAKKGISSTFMTFLIDDFTVYNHKQRILKRYRELKKKKGQWESTTEEIKERQNLDLPIRSYLFDQLVNKKLTEDEENELYGNEMELDERLMELNSRELSLEQWSFIKSLYPSLDEIAFFELTSSLSSEFVGHLNLFKDESKGNNVNLIIKNKFMNHCNLIADGVIKFVKRDNASEV